MSAPALILLSSGRRDRAVAQVSQQIRTELLAIRPQLAVHSASAGDPSGALSVVTQLVKRGAEEIVLVPLLLSDAFAPQRELPALLSQVRAAHPSLNAIASRPIGPEAQLLAVIDRRLRDALRARRVSELDGLVFSAAGTSDVRSNALVSRRARQWATHHRLPCVTALANGPGPSTGEAIRTLRAQGRRHIAVGSWYLAPDDGFRRQAAQALESGAVAVSAPLGAGPEIAEAALARYVVAALDLVDLELASAEAAPERHLSVVGA